LPGSKREKRTRESVGGPEEIGEKEESRLRRREIGEMEVRRVSRK
jgi:hypothetical protein